MLRLQYHLSKIDFRGLFFSAIYTILFTGAKMVLWRCPIDTPLFNAALIRY